MSRLRPECGQDRGGRHHYEGYYARLSLPDEGESLAIIGAMARSDAGTEVYAILLDGRAAKRTLVRFAADDYALDSSRTDARFGTVTLSPDRIEGTVGDTTLALRLAGRERWPGLFRSPLGPGLLAPGLESYWHAASIAGTWRGTLVRGGTERRIDGAPGYVEKTWGSSFPARWTWLHAHTFDRPGVAVAASRAPAKLFGVLPLKAGVLALRDGSRTLTFATYAGDRVDMDAEGGAFTVCAENREHRVLLDARLPQDAMVSLEGPLPSGVAPAALETLVGTAELILERRTRSGYSTVWRAKTSLAGLEVGGKDRHARCGL